MAEKTEMREKMDFKDLLFLQILQMTRENHDDEMFEHNLDMLEATLSPYIDPDYTAAIKPLEEEHQMNKNKSNSIVISRSFCKKKFRLLMELARRKGHLPEESTEYRFTSEDSD